jgi:hypothetical protein
MKVDKMDYKKYLDEKGTGKILVSYTGGDRTGYFRRYEVVKASKVRVEYAPQCSTQGEIWIEEFDGVTRNYDKSSGEFYQIATG